MELFDYIEVFYNQRRRHSTLGQISPAAFERRARRRGRGRHGKPPRPRFPTAPTPVHVLRDRRPKTDANHVVKPSTESDQAQNRIDQRQCFLRVIPVGTGQPDGERHASRVANQMTLAPSLGAIRGIWTGLRTAVHRADRAAVNNRSGPIDVAFAGEPIQEREVHQIPDSFRLPVAQASPACHARTTAQFLRQHLPWYSAAQHEQDAGQAGAIRHTRPSAVRPRWWKRQKRFDKFPQRVGQQRGGHKPTLRRPQLSDVLSGRFCYAL